MDGIIPTSIAPSCSSAAHVDGTSNRSAKRSASPLEAVDERPRVEIVDRAEANHGHQASNSKRPSRSTASRAAARMLPWISSMGASPRTKHAGVDGRDPVHVVGADRQRDLRELGTVERPVHLDRLDVGRRPAARARPASRRRTRSLAL